MCGAASAFTVLRLDEQFYQAFLLGGGAGKGNLIICMVQICVLIGKNVRIFYCTKRNLRSYSQNHFKISSQKITDIIILTH